MSSLGFRILFRKEGAASSILAIALLAAILVSMNSIINHVNLQVEAIGEFAGLSRTYLVFSKDSTSILDSDIDLTLVGELREIDDLKYVQAQKVFDAIINDDFNRKVRVRGVEDVVGFQEKMGGTLNGVAARNGAEAIIGEMLSEILGVDLGDIVSLAVNGSVFEVEIVGVFRSFTQTDAELIVPIETTHLLSKKESVSLVEIAFKNRVDSRGVNDQVTEISSNNLKLVEVQRVDAFLRDVNLDTLSFLSQWSLSISVVVVTASYVVASRFVTENTYELGMLKALGASRFSVFKLVAFYTLTISFFGTLFGSALGVAGSQILSTAVRWMFRIDMAPFIGVEQLLAILFLILVSSFLGCVPPAFKASRKDYVEDLV